MWTDISLENEEAAKERGLMVNVDMQAITRDVSQRLESRRNGVRLHVDEQQSYASPVTVYVFVSIDDGGGKSSLDLIRLFESVERETAERFKVDVLVLPARPSMP